MTSETCPTCGGPMPARPAGAGRPRKHCSRRCTNKAYRDNVRRQCGHEGCSRPVRARGVCSTHYNQTIPTDQRHRKELVSCAVCGRQVSRRSDKLASRTPCCSSTCRFVLQVGADASPSGSYTWNADAKSRATKLGATVIEDVDRDAVLERDDWRCYICATDLTLTDDVFSPDSATVDHVVPLSHGGAHAMGNVRACCLGCNSRKAGTALPVPALVGVAPLG